MLRFGRLLNDKKLGEALFASVGRGQQVRGIKVNTVTIVNSDATIIEATNTAKNEDKARDPDTHQIRKCRRWYFGMKLHIGVYSQTGLNHSAVVTAAKVHNKHPPRSGESMGTQPMPARKP